MSIQTWAPIAIALLALIVSFLAVRKASLAAQAQIVLSFLEQYGSREMEEALSRLGKVQEKLSDALLEDYKAIKSKAEAEAVWPDVEEMGVDEVRAAIRKATLAMEIFPVLGGSAFKNKGVQPFLDGVIHFLPSPLDVPAVMGFEVDADDDAEATIKRTVVMMILLQHLHLKLLLTRL